MMVKTQCERCSVFDTTVAAIVALDVSAGWRLSFDSAVYLCGYCVDDIIQELQMILEEQNAYKTRHD